MTIRVMHLVRPADGGIREHVKRLAGGLPPREFAAIVVCPAASPLYRELPSSIAKIPLALCDGMHPWSDLRSVLHLRQLLDRQPVDILHMHGAKAALIGRMAAALAKRQPRLVCTLHNFIAPDNRLLQTLFLNLENRLAARTDRYIAVSNALAEQVRRQIGSTADKVVVVYNGLPPAAGRFSRRQARTVMNVPQDAVVIGTIARLIPEKGVDDLLLAFRTLVQSGHNCYLAVIGDGPQKRDLQKLSSDLQDRIRWLGAVDEASRLLPGFDLYVQSSRREGFGLAVLEAMREGVPVIATAVGGLPELVGSLGQPVTDTAGTPIRVNQGIDTACLESGGNPATDMAGWENRGDVCTEAAGAGMLVPADDPRRLAGCMQQVLANEQLRRALAIAGRRRAEERFSLERMIRHTIRVYREVLERREFA
ncbi:glycosyltransferase family 4 protein [Effusibacillus pohliae]|uniref:glycosyltransferase family 4 protein n=1 Tax=Effusibacillus pohliae TaxID=232270 RepID=UPI00146164D5|nr:glycosyltransferase family 4 protein [Effusibacillus pohliae]